VEAVWGDATWQPASEQENNKDNVTTSWQTNGRWRGGISGKGVWWDVEDEAQADNITINWTKGAWQEVETEVPADNMITKREKGETNELLCWWSMMARRMTNKTPPGNRHGKVTVTAPVSKTVLWLNLCLRWWTAGIGRPVPVGAEMRCLCGE
jgi:hypothetical protein